MQLDFFPGFGVPAGDSHWRLMVAGVVRQEYVPTVGKRVLIRMLGNAMDASEEQLSSPEFVRRVSPFVADGARSLGIALRLGDSRLALSKPTRRNGHFRQNVLVDRLAVQSHVHRDPHGRMFLKPEVEAGIAGQPLFAEGEIWLVPDRGLSVISDVDDTIKESAIGDRRELLVNTFLRSFRPIPGMSGLYAEWAAAGVHFHYVSTSPCQLLQPLLTMRESHGFPGGSVHLREFRLRNHVLKKLARIRRSSKSSTIQKLVEVQPGRKFLLIGDAGETDIEIYRKAARNHPDRILGVLIRRLEELDFPESRFEKARRSTPRVPFQVFSTAAELAEIAQPLIERAQSRQV